MLSNEEQKKLEKQWLAEQMKDPEFRKGWEEANELHSKAGRADLLEELLSWLWDRSTGATDRRSIEKLDAVADAVDEYRARIDAPPVKRPWQWDTAPKSKMNVLEWVRQVISDETSLGLLEPVDHGKLREAMITTLQEYWSNLPDWELHGAANALMLNVLEPILKKYEEEVDAWRRDNDLARSAVTQNTDIDLRTVTLVSSMVGLLLIEINQQQASIAMAVNHKNRVVALHQPVNYAGQALCGHCSRFDGIRCLSMITPYPCETLRIFIDDNEAEKKMKEAGMTEMERVAMAGHKIWMAKHPLQGEARDCE